MEFEEIDPFIEEFLESWSLEAPKPIVIKALNESINQFDDLYRLLAQ